MIEILAAITGASISVAAVAMGGISKRNVEGREAVIRLTEAVNTVATRLDELHVDLKVERRETFSRLNTCEQRLAKLEVRPYPGTPSSDMRHHPTD